MKWLASSWEFFFLGFFILIFCFVSSMAMELCHMFNLNICWSYLHYFFCFSPFSLVRNALNKFMENFNSHLKWFAVSQQENQSMGRNGNFFGYVSNDVLNRTFRKKKEIFMLSGKIFVLDFDWFKCRSQS